MTRHNSIDKRIDKGTAQRTESSIIEETARPLLNSTPIIENTITVDIGSVISQNRLTS
ncbi:MAG: hypothetical protein GY783_13325 [Gammaproteobacteria bacterium]|nr:hypothetical protein [Gammaproteobacteria bacterium]